MEVSNQHVLLWRLVYFFYFFFFLHLAWYTQWKNCPLPPWGLKNLPVRQENQMERGRWNSKKKMSKGILGQGILCPIVLFCFVYINFSSSRFCFQEILMLNVIIYRWSFISFHAFSFSGKVYNGKCCCTPFEILHLQTFLFSSWWKHESHWMLLK